MPSPRSHAKEPSTTRYAVLGVAAGVSVLAAGAAAGGIVARVSDAHAAAATSNTPAVSVDDPSTYSQSQTPQTDDYYYSDDDNRPAYSDDDGYLGSGSSPYTDTQVIPSAPNFGGSFSPPQSSSRQS